MFPRDLIPQSSSGSQLREKVERVSKRVSIDLPASSANQDPQVCAARYEPLKDPAHALSVSLASAELPVEAVVAAAVPAAPPEWVNDVQQLLQTMPEESVRSFLTGWDIELLATRSSEVGLSARGGKGILITRLLNYVQALPLAVAPPPANASRTRRRRMD